MFYNSVFLGGRESLIFSLVTSSSFFFKSESGERKEQITIFLTASIYWLIGSQNVAPKGETTDSSKSRTDNTTLLVFTHSGIKKISNASFNFVGRSPDTVFFFTVNKVIIEKSRGEVSPMGQDTIENIS